MKYHVENKRAKAARCVVLVLFFSIYWTKPTRAQSQDVQKPDLQQMQKKLDQLEKEMRELREQMNAALQAQSSVVVATAAVATPASSPAMGSVQASPQKPEESSEKPKVGSTLDMYGYAMLDSGYNFGSIDPNWFDVMRPTKLNAAPGEFAPDGSTYWGVRQSRFGVKSFTPTPLGDLKTVFEFELFGTGVDAGQTTFRLRQAYGELGHFGAGQTWSAFMDIDVFPNSLEYWGPNGMVFFRNVQFRWMPIQGASHVTIALERPGASADGGIYADRLELQGIRPQFKYPDLTGDARLARKWGYVQMGAIYRRIAWVDTIATSTLNLSGATNGWGVNVSSNLKFTKKDVGKFQVVYGKGIENYMNDAPIDIGVKNNFGNPVKPIIGVPLPVLGVVAFVDHTWSSKFTSSIGYSLVNIENSNADAVSDFHQGDYALVNLLFHPLSRVTMGSEFQFGRRVNFKDGFNVDDYKMQFSFKYDWSKGFEF